MKFSNSGIERNSQKMIDSYLLPPRTHIQTQRQSVATLNSIKEAFRKNLPKSVRYLTFLGLPTGNYEKQMQWKAIDLYRFFTPPDFRIENDKSGQPHSLRHILKNFKHTVIQGAPGAGKTTLLNYLVLYLHQEEHGPNKEVARNRIPFLVTIRDYLQKKERSRGLYGIEDYLSDISWEIFNLNYFNKSFFKALLKKGYAAVLFDGLDEVSDETEAVLISAEIKAFRANYENCIIWVTSRFVGYSGEVELNRDDFKHCRLEPFSSKKIGTFVDNFYKIQLPCNEELREQCSQSLTQAICENDAVKTLAANPLMLTMITLLHQFDGVLPERRAVVYERCIELLLKTWQERRFGAPNGMRSFFPNSKLKYQDQLNLLGAVASHIQEKSNQGDRTFRGTVNYDELQTVLFNSRYDARRMTKHDAKQDRDDMFHYLSNTTGFLVEKNTSSQNRYFSFIHLSFVEYLCAYWISGDRSLTQREHLLRLSAYIDNPNWEETILLCLYLFQKTGGFAFIDEFCGLMFQKIDEMPETAAAQGWCLMGRAVRDNLDFSPMQIETILRKMILLWLRDIYNSKVFQVLTEVFLFSHEGKITMKMLFNSKHKLLQDEDNDDFNRLNCLWQKIRASARKKYELKGPGDDTVI